MRKINTLKKNYEFKNVLNHGKYFVKDQITVYINRNKLDKNCIGIAVNTKVGHAVTRNRIKRLIRENYRLMQKDIKKGYNIVFLWNKRVNPMDADFYKIKQEMKEIFSLVKLL